MLARRDELALFAGAVRQVTCAALAHEGLCQNARHGGLASAARAAEEVRVAHLALENRALEGLDHVLLANNLFERLWAVLRVERFHGTSAPSCLRFPVYPRASAMGHAPPRHLERRPRAATAPLGTTISVKTRFRRETDVRSGVSYMIPSKGCLPAPFYRRRVGFRSRRVRNTRCGVSPYAGSTMVTPKRSPWARMLIEPP